MSPDPITSSPAFWVGDKAYPTLEKAKQATLEQILEDAGIAEDIARAAAEAIMGNAAAVMDVLTTTKRSRPRRRKLHGGKRQPKVTPMPSESQLPLSS